MRPAATVSAKKILQLRDVTKLKELRKMFNAAKD
jgi:hypothetical protein